MNKEKLILPQKAALKILDESNPEYIIIVNEINGTGRWTIEYHLVIQRVSDQKYFSAGYYQGATESQDVGPWEGEETVEFIEVSPIKVETVIYK